MKPLAVLRLHALTVVTRMMGNHLTSDPKLGRLDVAAVLSSLSALPGQSQLTAVAPGLAAAAYVRGAENLLHTPPSTHLVVGEELPAPAIEESYRREEAQRLYFPVVLEKELEPTP